MKAKTTYRNLVPAGEQALKILLFLAGDRSGKKSVAEICGFRNQTVGRVQADPQPRHPKRTYTWIGRRRAMWDTSLRSARYFRRGDTLFMTLFF
jgi:hypothetical protein